MRFLTAIGGTALALCLACASALAQTSSSCPPNQYLNKLGSPPAACAAVGPGNLPAQPASTLLGNPTGSVAAPTTIPLTAPLGFSAGSEVLRFASPLANQAGSLGVNLNSPLLAEGTTTVLKAVGPPGGRLTPLSQNPTTSAPNLGQVTTVFYTHYLSDQVPVWDGTNLVYLTIPGTEVSDALPASASGVVNANDVFDIFAVDSGGILAICHVTNGSGGGWVADGGSLTARGTGYSSVSFNSSFPLATNANSITNCYNGAINLGPIAAKTGTYLGTFATNAAGSYLFNTQPPSASGGPSGTNLAQVGLWNMYNRRWLSVLSADSGVSYTYNSSTVRAARGSTNNSVSMVSGFGADNTSTQVRFVSTMGTAAVAGSTGRMAPSFVTTSFTNGNSSFAACITATANIQYCNSPSTDIMSAGNGLITIYRVENTDGSTVTFDVNNADFIVLTYPQ